jgi:hypothetical protein
MKKALIIIPFAALVATTGCVPMYGAAMHGSPAMFPIRPGVYGPSVGLGSTGPIGRWDNVMMLPRGTSIDVLTADGQRTSATFVTATNTLLRVESDSAESEIPAETVVRIDRWYGGPVGTKSVARDAAKGAAVGAGAMGVLGLLSGIVPPARVVAGGAIIGAYNYAESGRAMRTSTIVYLAPGPVRNSFSPDPDRGTR